ncbi:MAG TPA: histidine kinase dimerization/phospho-acceptor domain-containing protein [Terracidiphilus sp.]|jgi:signal transduction histidine kinase
MHDWYQIPALILTTLLLPAFGHLYWRSRDTRALLWFFALFFSALRMFLLYPTGQWDFSVGPHPWLAAAGQASALLSSGLFLGSLSPLRFRLGKVEILYVIPFTLPLVAFAIFAFGFFKGESPHGAAFLLFPCLGMIAVVAGMRWGLAKNTLPTWIGSVVCLVFGGVALWFCFRHDPYWALTIAESGNHVVAALLVWFVFRRFSSGVVLSTLGFLLWALPVIFLVPQVSTDPLVRLSLVRLITMAQVVTAIGLILLVLENELSLNRAIGDREHRARKELEAYTGLVLSRRRVEDFDRQANDVCKTVVDHSRFAQCALILMHHSGVYRLAGASGLDPATEKALDSLAARISVDGFLAVETAKQAIESHTQVQTQILDLEQWLSPGDDLRRLHFTSALAIPLLGRAATEGALLFTGMRNAAEPLRADDLLPIEMLAARLQAVRSQTTMMEKLIESEKFAGLGQLAGTVTQQLNNPLTVILGYASLIEETPNLGDHERRGIEAILSEARHMRTTLESLSRVARSPSGARAAISVAELLSDLEKLHRAEFLQRSIELRLDISPAVPRVLCHAQQLRQAVLHCLQFAMEAVDHGDHTADRLVRMEARADAGRVQITVSHSGPGFFSPERAFDPYLPPQSIGVETAGLGLSLCATILRDNNGNASARNLEPQGAAIVLELQAA